MTVLALVGVLLAVTVWSMRSFIVGNRVGAAAREFTSRMRNAAAIAARTNRPVEIVFVEVGAGCVPRYEVRSAGLNPVTYETICLATEYSGVAVDAGPMADKAVQFGAETALPICSLCTGTKTLTFFPSGEVTTSGVSAAGDSVIFSVSGDTSPANVLAVGVRNVSGRTRIYRPTGDGSAWECP